jgi:AcrR family transcriptional regulator
MPRAGLSRATVVASGADLADKSGWEALTLAALAEQLGVRQPSLYKHVAGFAALRREIQLLALRELQTVTAQAAVGRSGTDAVEAIALAYRGYAKAHPGRYAASVLAPPADDPDLAEAAAVLLGTVTAVLDGFGLHASDAIDAVRGLRALMHGFVTLELAGGFALPLDLDESYRRLVRGFARSLMRY